ncbi:MAG: glycosyltransferase [Actinomycetota bacterium]
MDWVVAAPYFETADDRWISDSVVGGRHRFTLVPRVGDDRNWHQASASAGVGEWADRGRQAVAALGAPADGIITVFPQLAATTAGLKLVRRDHRPLVAWLFNTEGIATGVRRAGARVALRKVDRFVVHSTAEIPVYQRLLGLPAERFSFVPLQYGGDVETARPPDQDEPYVFATGTGYRDYETFFAAVGKLGHRTLVLASDRALDGLTVPDNVEILPQISRPEIRRLVRHAAVNVVPLTDGGTTAGLVTIVETFRHGRSMVITRRSGLDDYCNENDNVLCADLGDVGELAAAIDRMWGDEAERARLDAAALEFAEANCTDAAAAAALVDVLDGLAGQPVGEPR